MDKRLKYLNAIRSFECAARYQSYSKAAEELFVSQAAISQQMRQLEEVLGVQLFTRVGHIMQLTPSGEKLYNASHQGLNIISQGLNSIQNEGLDGELIITSTQAFCSMWLMSRLYKFSLLYPAINVKILGSNQVENLQKKHIDLAIRFGNKEHLKKDDLLTWVPFGEDTVYPVCSPSLIQTMPLKSPEDLLRCQLVSLANESHITWKSWFDSIGVKGFDKHNNKLEVTSSDMAVNSVITGHSVTLAASGMFGAYMQSGQLVVPFFHEHPYKWQRHIVYDAHSVKQKRICVFKDWLIDEMKLTESAISDENRNNYA
jgi:LysR family glycine cleavage system transcriptional activator